MIYVGNLVDFLTVGIKHPAAAGQTYLVSDGQDVSTPDLIRRTATALGVSPRLFPFPVRLLKLVGLIVGKKNSVIRLTGSLAVDSSKIIMELGCQPKYTFQEGLEVTAKWYLLNHGSTL